MLAAIEHPPVSSGKITRGLTKTQSEQPALPEAVQAELRTPAKTFPVMTLQDARKAEPGTNWLAPVDWLEEDAENERKTYDHSKLIDLAANMRNKGHNSVPVVVRLMPITRPDGTPRLQIIKGHRRTRALKLDGRPHALIMIEVPQSDLQRAIERFTDNLFQEKLSPLEEAEGWRNLMKLGQYSSVELMCERTGQLRNARTIRDMLSLEKLVPEVKEQLAAGKITASHAVKLASKPAEKQAVLLKECGFERYGPRHGEMVSEKEFRQNIENFERNEKWQAERKAREEKEAAAAAKAKAVAPGAKTKEQLENAKRLAKVKAENEKTRTRLRAAMSELLDALAGGELPTEALRMLAENVDCWGHPGEVLEKHFAIPSSRMKRAAVLARVERPKLIEFLVCSLGLCAMEGYDTSRKARHKAMLAELQSRPKKDGRLPKAGEPPEDIKEIFRNVIIDKALDAILSGTVGAGNRWKRIKGMLTTDVNLMSMIVSEMNASMAAQMGTEKSIIDDTWAAKFSGGGQDQGAYVQLSLIGKKPFCTLKGESLLAAVRRVFKL